MLRMTVFLSYYITTIRKNNLNKKNQRIRTKKAGLLERAAHIKYDKYVRARHGIFEQKQRDSDILILYPMRGR